MNQYPEGITRDDTVHGQTYYTAADMATASAQGFRDGVASLSAAEPAIPALQPVAPQIDLRNFKQFYDVSEFTVAMSFMSCRAAQQFKREVSAALSKPAPALTQGAAIAAGRQQSRKIEECYGDCPTDPKTCANPCNFVGRASHGQAPAQPDHWKSLLEAVMREMPHRRAAGGNAPGHAHNIPGVWDSDNGALAGKECAWCLAWNTAQRVLVSPPSPQAAQQAPAGASIDITEAAQAIAVEVAKNCGSVPQLTFPHIYLGLKKLLAAPAAPSTPASGGWMPIETAPRTGVFLVRGGKWIGEINGPDKYDMALVEVNHKGRLDVTNTDAYYAYIEGATEWAPASPTIEGESNG